MTFPKWFVSIAALLLAGCAVVSAPRGPQDRPPALADDALITRDGLSLPMRHWDAAGKPRAIIVALHGMNDYSNAFDAPAKLWAKTGITTLAYDQRGFGQGPNPGLWAGADALRQDFRDCLALARARYPGLPVFALGESMGGAVILTALAEPDPLRPDGVVLVSPAVWSRADMPLLYRTALFLGAHLLPGMIVTGNGLKIVVSDNIDMLRALSRDPYVIKKTRVDAVYGLVNLMDEARQAPDHISQPPPILYLAGKNDPIIPPASTQAVIAALDGRATAKTYDKGYHMLLRDLEGPAVAQDVADWVRQRTGG